MSTNIATMNNLESIIRYYSTFINSISKIGKSYGGKVLKNIGDSILFYFPKTSDINNANSFQEAIECDFKILDERYKINDELIKKHLPPVQLQNEFRLWCIRFSFSRRLQSNRFIWLNIEFMFKDKFFLSVYSE
ncbi:MAG TPA: hypothetical protein VEW92_05485 [Nitrososphaeraceae archaeon]|nr:hypothetical protein [Nitrososphaeraceae archaeon]